MAYAPLLLNRRHDAARCQHLQRRSTEPEYTRHVRKVYTRHIRKVYTRHVRKVYTRHVRKVCTRHVHKVCTRHVRKVCTDLPVVWSGMLYSSENCDYDDLIWIKVKVKDRLHTEDELWDMLSCMRYSVDTVT